MISPTASRNSGLSITAINTSDYIIKIAKRARSINSALRLLGLYNIKIGIPIYPLGVGRPKTDLDLAVLVMRHNLPT